MLRFRLAMPLEVLQRLTWNGTPREIGDLFRLHKNRKTSGDLQPSIRLVPLLVGSQPEVVQTQVCRTQEEVLSTGGVKSRDDQKGWL